MKIAIDGPAGAGKSTIAKLLSKKLDIVYLDTGAMYRAVGLYCFNNNINFDDHDKVKQALNDINLEIHYDNGSQLVILNGKDVSTDIRQNHVSKLASDISALPFVRDWLVQMQRTIADKTSTVLDGRDIGTFVLPNAEYKFFLTASVSERAKRRFNELRQKGVDCKLEDIETDIKKRDYNDSHRAYAPLKQADDAILVDTTFLSIDEVVNKLLSYIK